MFSLDAYDYDLPPERIAQHPVRERDRSHLLVLDRRTGELSHHVFRDLDHLLAHDDVLVINNTEVIPARLHGRKDSGGHVEILIADYGGGSSNRRTAGAFVCECLVRSAKRPTPGSVVYFDEGLTAEVVDSRNGTYTLKFHCDSDFEGILYRIGEVPLPPYIKRRRTRALSCDDRTFYQTVYAAERGAVAAPTAGLHFTEQLLKKLAARGVQIVAITLHVGCGTFLPVRAADIRQHKMQAERFSISPASADTLNAARAAGQRIIAVGTTCVRTLEYAANDRGEIYPGRGYCDLFIYPGYRFRSVDAIITNFHLPQSTLLMLVAAFAGRERILSAYNEAIKKGYRFYSYGDAMFIV